MLNLPRLGVISRKMFYPCKLNQIPLLRSDYYYDKTLIMKNLHLYEFPKRNLICKRRRSKVKERKVKLTMNSLPAYTAFAMTAKTSDEANASDFKRQRENDKNFGYLRTEEYKRISPEFLKILKHSSYAEKYITHRIQKFEDKKLQESWIDEHFRPTQAKQGIEVNITEDPTSVYVETDEVATDVLKSKQESKQVWNPHLNQYLKHLMENEYIDDNINTDHNYNIDKPRAGDELDVLNIKEILDPSKVIYLLSILHREGYIQPLQLMYLMGYLRAIVTFGAHKFSELLDRLYETDLLNEQILNYFEFVLLQMNQGISNTKFNIIFRKLAQVRDDLKCKSFKLPLEKKELRTPEKELNCNAGEIELNNDNKYKINKIFLPGNYKIIKKADQVHEEAEGQDATNILRATQKDSEHVDKLFKKIETIPIVEPKSLPEVPIEIREVKKPLDPITRQAKKKTHERRKKEEESNYLFDIDKTSDQTTKASDKQQMLTKTKSDNAKNQVAKESTKKDLSNERQMKDSKGKEHEQKPHEEKTKNLESSEEDKENKVKKELNVKITSFKSPERKLNLKASIKESPITPKKTGIKFESVKERNKEKTIKSYITPSIPKTTKQTNQQKILKHSERERVEKAISDKKKLETLEILKNGSTNISTNLKNVNKAVENDTESLEPGGLQEINEKNVEYLSALKSARESDFSQSDEDLEVEENQEIDKELSNESIQSQMKKLFRSQETGNVVNVISDASDILEDYRRGSYNKLQKFLESETTDYNPRGTKNTDQAQKKKSIDVDERMSIKKHKLSNILGMLRNAMQNIEFDKSSEVERLQHITQYTDNKFSKIPPSPQEQKDKFQDISGVLKEITHFNKMKQGKSFEAALDNALNISDSKKDMKLIDQRKIEKFDIIFSHDKLGKNFETKKSRRKKKKYLELKDLERIDSKFKRIAQKAEDPNDEINRDIKSFEAFMKFVEASESDLKKRPKRVIIPRNKIERILRDTIPQSRFNIAKNGYYEPINSEKFSNYKEINLVQKKSSKERRNSLILRKKAYRPKIRLYDSEEDGDDDDYDEFENRKESTVHPTQLRESAVFMKAPWNPKSKLMMVKKLPIYLKTLKEFRSGNIDYIKTELDMDQMKRVARLSMGIRDSINLNQSEPNYNF